MLYGMVPNLISVFRRYVAIMGRSSQIVPSKVTFVRMGLFKKPLVWTHLNRMGELSRKIAIFSMSQEHYVFKLLYPLIFGVSVSSL